MTRRAAIPSAVAILIGLFAALALPRFVDLYRSSI
jgi:hypothetical protein